MKTVLKVEQRSYRADGEFHFGEELGIRNYELGGGGECKEDSKKKCRAVEDLLRSYYPAEAVPVVDARCFNADDMASWADA